MIDSCGTVHMAPVPTSIIDLDWNVYSSLEMKLPLMRSNNDVTVKSFNFVGTKFRGLTTLGIFVDT